MGLPSTTSMLTSSRTSRMRGARSNHGGTYCSAVAISGGLVSSSTALCGRARNSASSKRGAPSIRSEHGSKRSTCRACNQDEQARPACTGAQTPELARGALQGGILSDLGSSLPYFGDCSKEPLRHLVHHYATRDLAVGKLQVAEDARVQLLDERRRTGTGEEARSNEYEAPAYCRTGQRGHHGPNQQPIQDRVASVGASSRQSGDAAGYEERQKYTGQPEASSHDDRAATREFVAFERHQRKSDCRSERQENGQQREEHDRAR